MKTKTFADSMTKFLKLCHLKLQHFQHISMGHFSDIQYFAQQFSLVEIQKGCLYNRRKGGAMCKTPKQVRH